MPVATASYVELAHEYAEDVVAGRIVAGKWERLACKRQLDDLENPPTYQDLEPDGSPGESGTYWFDDDAAERVCQIIEKFPHIKGAWARRKEKITLEPWQCFIVCVVFGWKREDGLRRFRSAYTEVARKNAKTTLLACLGLYMLAADDEPGSEVYSAATTRDQAKEVFNIARRMALREKGYRDRFGVEVLRNNISVEESDSKFEPLSADAKTLDGKSPHMGIIDELHAHKTNEVYDVIDTGTGSRDGSLMWAITTAGYDRAGVCYRERTYATKVLDGTADAQTHFAVIYTIDDGDDWMDPRVWRKANPNLGVSVYTGGVAEQCEKAKQSPASRNAFLTKRLNVWTSADVAWMRMEKWEACANPEMTLDEFEGEPCFIGLDISSRSDLCSMALLFPDGDNYNLFVRNYLPWEAIETARNAQYRGWHESGLLTVAGGETMDQKVVADDLRAYMARFDVVEVPFDPWDATQFANQMLEEGVPMVEFRPTVRNISEPMKAFEALTLEGLLHHDGNPILAWAVSNVIAKLDSNDNIRPDKERPENKIDPVVASMTALGRAIVTDSTGSMYDEEGITFV